MRFSGLATFAQHTFFLFFSTFTTYNYTFVFTAFGYKFRFCIAIGDSFASSLPLFTVCLLFKSVKAPHAPEAAAPTNILPSAATRTFVLLRTLMHVVCLLHLFRMMSVGWVFVFNVADKVDG